MRSWKVIDVPVIPGGNRVKLTIRFKCSRIRLKKDTWEMRDIPYITQISCIFHSLIFHRYSQRIAFPNFTQSRRITF